MLGSQYHDSTIIPSIAAVIARTKYRYTSTIMLLRETTAVIWKLVASNDKPQFVLHAELRGEVWSELYADPSFRLKLPGLIRGVAPDKI
jgi:hypothetical protein